MLSKATLALLAVAVAQVSASAIQPLLQRRSLEILYNRQSSCDSICSPFENAVNTCSTTTCLCTAANTKSLQGCINCAVAANTAAVDDANTLATTYNEACSGSSAGAVTVPAGGSTPSTGGAGGGTGGTSVRPSVVTTPSVTSSPTGGAGTTSRPVVTVTSNPSVVPTLTQTVVKPTSGGSGDPSATGGGDVPAGLAGGALSDVAQKGLVMVVGAIVGGALVL